MTDSERAQIKSRLSRGWYRRASGAAIESEIEGLLADVERLERENAALRETLETRRQMDVMNTPFDI